MEQLTGSQKLFGVVVSIAIVCAIAYSIGKTEGMEKAFEESTLISCDEYGCSMDTAYNGEQFLSCPNGKICEVREPVTVEEKESIVKQEDIQKEMERILKEMESE